MNEPNGISKIEVQEYLYRAMDALNRGDTELLRTLLDMVDDMVNNDSIRLRWSTEDVIYAHPKISEEDAIKVLRAVKKCHNADVGVTWDVISDVADDLGFDTSRGD